MNSRKASRIYRTLQKAYPNAHCALNFSNPLELLLATILSAQCTDQKVNQVTAVLFQKYKTAQDYQNAAPDELETLIRPTGFFRQKAKSLRGACDRIVSIHGGKVPAQLEELIKLPGVGRKTANVVLGNAFGLPGLPVDTHVGRVSRRLGYTEHEDPEKIELDLHRVLPPEDWTMFSHTLIFHGRALCKARNPLCARCPVRGDCIFEGKDPERGI